MGLLLFRNIRLTLAISSAAVAGLVAIAVWLPDALSYAAHIVAVVGVAAVVLEVTNRVVSRHRGTLVRDALTDLVSGDEGRWADAAITLQKYPRQSIEPLLRLARDPQASQEVTQRAVQALIAIAESGGRRADRLSAARALLDADEGQGGVPATAVARLLADTDQAVANAAVLMLAAYRAAGNALRSVLSGNGSPRGVLIRAALALGMNVTEAAKAADASLLRALSVRPQRGEAGRLCGLMFRYWQVERPNADHTRPAPREEWIRALDWLSGCDLSRGAHAVIASVEQHVEHSPRGEG